MKDRYLSQIKLGCKKHNCVKMFCRKISDTEVSENVSTILSTYGDIFICENINNLISKNIAREQCSDKGQNTVDNKVNNIMEMHDPIKQIPSRTNKGHWLIHLFFSYLKILNSLRDVSAYSTQIKGDLSEKEVNLRTTKYIELEVENIHLSKNYTDTHKFCKFVNKELFDETEKYLLEGILYFLIKLYDKQHCLLLRLLILRLYLIAPIQEISHLNIIHQILGNMYKTNNKKCNFIRSRPNDFENICNVTFENIPMENMKEEDLKKVSEPANIINEYTKDACDNVSLENITFCANATLVNKKFLCLDNNQLNKNDLFLLINKFVNIAESFTDINIRENKKLEIVLNILGSLFVLNEKLRVVQAKKFYLHKLTDKLNFKEEYKFYRIKGRSLLNYGFMLPLSVKADLLKAENGDYMKSSLQDSFFRALFEGHVEPYLFITINRDNIYEDSINVLEKINYNDVHKQLKITFKGEEGVDSGGIRKEYFQLLSQDIKGDTSIFYSSRNYIWIKDDCKEVKKYYSIGKILGIALYNNVVLNIPFPKVFFKKLLGKKTSFNDLKEIDHELYVSLSKLDLLSSEELEKLELQFTVSYKSSDGTIKNVDLSSNTESKITKDNLQLFKNKYADLFINKLVASQFEAIKEGFYYVIDKNVLASLKPKELERIMMGSNEFKIDELKETTTYSGYTPNSPIIIHFWEIFESYNKKMKKKLLQFITGHDRIPVYGSGSLKLIIMRNGCDTDRLPSAQTCFNTFLLPEYSSKEKLKSKLKTALELTAGFFLL